MAWHQIPPGRLIKECQNNTHHIITLGLKIEEPAQSSGSLESVGQSDSDRIPLAAVCLGRGNDYCAFAAHNLLLHGRCVDRRTDRLVGR